MDAPMTERTPDSGRIAADRYFAMAECGIIASDDRVELLEGLIVAMAPQSPLRASTISRIHRALLRGLGPDTLIRIQSSLPLSGSSVPEPDIAVVPGRAEDYLRHHPSHAHLVIEVADSSLVQDRITKAAIYARAGVPCYWVVNLRHHRVEVLRDPEPRMARYRSVAAATATQQLTIDAFPGVFFTAADLLPPSETEVLP